MSFGDRRGFAIEIGAREGGLVVVDLWAAGRALSVDDHHVFVPQFCLAVEATLEGWRDEGPPPRPWPSEGPEENHRRLALDPDRHRAHVFADWGPTTDELVSYAFGDGDDVWLTFARTRAHVPPGERGVFASRCSRAALVADLRSMVGVLRAM